MIRIGRVARLAMCEGKQIYDSALVAKKAAKRQPGRMAYKCHVCREWHVGQVQFRPLRHRQPEKPGRINLVEMTDDL